MEVEPRILAWKGCPCLIRMFLSGDIFCPHTWQWRATMQHPFSPALSLPPSTLWNILARPDFGLFGDPLQAYHHSGLIHPEVGPPWVRLDMRGRLDFPLGLSLVQGYGGFFFFFFFLETGLRQRSNLFLNIDVLKGNCAAGSCPAPRMVTTLCVCASDVPNR